MAFPYLMYLASVGTCSSPPQAGFDALTNTTDVVLAIADTYEDSGTRYNTVTSTNIATSYYSICLSLNVILTFMIVIPLIMHIRNLRAATGTLDGSSGLHATAAAVVTMLIESCAPYAVTFMIYIIPWALYSPVAYLFPKVGSTMQVRVVSTLGHCRLIVGSTQVIGSYLIILRVAKRRAITSESISGTTGSIRFRSQGSTDGGGSLPPGDPASATEVDGETTREIIAGDENAIEEVPF